MQDFFEQVANATNLKSAGTGTATEVAVVAAITL